MNAWLAALVFIAVLRLAVALERWASVRQAAPATRAYVRCALCGAERESADVAPLDSWHVRALTARFRCKRACVEQRAA